MASAPPFADFAPPIRPPTALRRAIIAATRRDEKACVLSLLEERPIAGEQRAAVRETAERLIVGLRRQSRAGGIEALIQEYALSSEEGVALMCLAEALLRIPDNATRDALIRDKIVDGDWKSHLGQGRSLFVNAATWGLVVTGRLVDTGADRGLGASLTRLIARAGEPVIRRGVDLAMRLLGEQFVTGETIGEALRRARTREAQGFGYSFDMLGEAAATAADAARYFAQYESAIAAIGKASAGRGVIEGSGISVKLSALHPRYSRSQADRVMRELRPRLKALALMAKARDIGFNIDAEEADRLEVSLDLLESLACDPDLAGWDGLGFVVQAYGKRCPFVIDWLIDLARRSARRIMIRLVKGAYWDSEIKRAQVDGLADFPVYTRKVHTDVSYLVCAARLLSARDAIFPQFATHNAQTVASIYHMAGPEFRSGDYEFQCLHGMGEPLYEQVVGAGGLQRPCRIYAPVGTHETLLAYLVRRLLENGANSSFVNRIADPDVPASDLARDPFDDVLASADPGTRHPSIALPADILGTRRNSQGIDLADEGALAQLGAALAASAATDWRAEPAIAGLQIARPFHSVINPAESADRVGHAAFARERDAAHAARVAEVAAGRWAARPAAERAAMLERAADLMQEAMPALMSLAMREAGKSAANAVSEVREAIDFLRYYAQQAPALPHARPLGPVLCISPWNFPLAIFTGQVAAALAAGNAVLAKPAEETPLIAAEAVRLLHRAGIPRDVLQFLPGDGAIGAALVAAPQVAGVVFTGSTEVARSIQRQLAERLSPHGRPIPLIAETGGQNAMIVDSSALTEQVVADVLASAFDSAGQRCSALRVLCLQEDIADRTLAMLRGALDELRIGRPDRLAIDVGPVISAEARDRIEAHIEAMRGRGFAVHRARLSDKTANGTFVAPTIIEIGSVCDVKEEIFGPVLHVVRFAREEIAGLIDAINATGYGLTFGLHTRLDETVEQVTARIEAGNLYVNRNMIGAVVGVQPFGGRGLSGTGPKAGGPLYLRRLVRDPPVEDWMGQPDAAVFALADWLASEDEAASALVRAIAARSPLGREAELPGPVGERNVYALRPRGTVLLLPQSRLGLINQLACALASGNRFTISASEDLRGAVEGMPDGVRRRLGKGRPAVALIEGAPERIAAVQRDLARQDGPLVVMHAATTEEMGDPAAYCPLWLVEEVAIAVNTAAAGGNASLMMIG